MCEHRKAAFAYQPYTIKPRGARLTSPALFPNKECKLLSIFRQPSSANNDRRWPHILSAGQVAAYLRGITAAIKSGWANRTALVCL